jgi:hypothetical protein
MSSDFANNQVSDQASKRTNHPTPSYSFALDMAHHRRVHLIAGGNGSMPKSHDNRHHHLVANQNKHQFGVPCSTIR